MAGNVANVLMPPPPLGQFGALAVWAVFGKRDALHTHDQYLVHFAVVEDPVQGVKHRGIIDMQMTFMR